jgi:hypothetical protein
MHCCQRLAPLSRSGLLEPAVGCLWYIPRGENLVVSLQASPYEGLMAELPIFMCNSCAIAWHKALQQQQ